jgi:excisionase family DNA binding protein
MAGMFYSSQEAAEKLSKTEDELKQLVKEGKLREFRDGANVLFKVDEVENLMSESDVIGLAEEPELKVSKPEAPESEFPELEIEASETPEPESAAKEIPTAKTAEPSGLEAAPAEESAADTDEILLAPETGAPAPSDLTDADTALTGLGTSVLGETDQDYEVTDDTMAETAVPGGTAGTKPEVPLEEIEDDVNLDTFGSGSGLLDLSLQADDTSLGGILDEIYTAEGEGQEPGEVGAEPVGPAGVEPAQVIGEDELAVAQPAPAMGALAAPFVEAPPDAQSNMLGMLLFLPLVVIIYTTVVVVSGLKGVIPSILQSIQSFIWYIMGAAAVLALLVAGAAFLFAGERGTAVKKEKKPKEPKIKKVKEPKAKKVNKDKKA